MFVPARICKAVRPQGSMLFGSQPRRTRVPTSSTAALDVARIVKFSKKSLKIRLPFVIAHIDIYPRRH